MNKAKLLGVALPGLALLTATCAFTGCGGSDNPGSPNKTVAGTLTGVGNAPLAGDTVTYDKGTNGQQATVTDTNGRYKFVVPLNTITGSDSLTFSDAAGHLIDIVPLTLAPNTISVTVTTVAPPSPPPAATL